MTTIAPSIPRTLLDKVAYVPGGTGVLGAAIARGLGRAGARVVVGGTDELKLRAVMDSVLAAGGEAKAVAFDARSVKDIGRSVDGVCDYFGRCDILVNAVGIHREQSVLEATEESFDSVIDLNLKAAMFLGQAVARRQVQQGQGGRQVQILSVRASLALQGKGYSAYTSSKGGLAMIVRQHAVELAPHRINVNGVAPTFVQSEMAQHVLKNPEQRAKLLERIPLGRVAEPEDVVGPTLFFCGPGSDFVTGQILYVDGGLTACQ
ncbi:SDR family NAD(P)-dependent oxidoreductase [Sorangium sp. So ce1153]|uniref:SDR family NAD(P)-dependent oxidoreductase n=1 Tax=Sorangium sp. So ce1153 TaxID=3133333 RepID=UPI003F600958